MKYLKYSLYLLLLAFVACTSAVENDDSENNSDSDSLSTEESTDQSPDWEFLVEKDLGEGKKSMQGILASVGETGQEPMEYNVNIWNGLEEGKGMAYESFELWKEGDDFPEVTEWEMDYQFEKGRFDKFNNKVVEVTYTVESRPRAVDVLKVAPAEVEQGTQVVEGTLKEVWEHGDGPGSLILVTTDGKELSFEGDYQVEMEAEHQAMKGQNVFLLYKDIQQKLYLSAEILGDYK
jgi:hypothetical protein